MPLLPQQFEDDKTGTTFTLDAIPNRNKMLLRVYDANGNPMDYTFTMDLPTLAQSRLDWAAYYPHSQLAAEVAAESAGAGSGS